MMEADLQVRLMVVLKQEQGAAKLPWAEAPMEFEVVAYWEQAAVRRVLGLMSVPGSAMV